MIAKSKKRIMFTLPKDDIKNLDNLEKAFKEEGISCTKSDIILKAFREYFNNIILVGLANENKEEIKKC